MNEALRLQREQISALNESDYIDPTFESLLERGEGFRTTTPLNDQLQDDKTVESIIPNLSELQPEEISRIFKSSFSDLNKLLETFESVLSENEINCVEQDSTSTITKCILYF